MTLLERPLALVAPPPPEVQPSGTPPKQMLALLAHYRRHAVLFDLAWELALNDVRWPSSRRETDEWRHTLEATRNGWRAGYLRWRPLPSELATEQLSQDAVA